MTKILAAALLLLAPAAASQEYPPQNLSSRTQPRDCAVIEQVLTSYLEHGEEWGATSGFIGLHFFVLDRSQRVRAKDIPVSRYEFASEENELFNRIQTQQIFSSLARRAGFSASLTDCSLPARFSLVESLASVETVGHDEPYVSVMFQEYDAVIGVTLPGFSSDECQALVELRAEFNIWEERLIYYLRATETGWKVEHVFKSSMQGE